MIYNMDFLISAMVILLLILWHFLGQKRAEDLNNRVFLFFAVLGMNLLQVPFFSGRSQNRKDKRLSAIRSCRYEVGEAPKITTSYSLAILFASSSSSYARTTKG